MYLRIIWNVLNYFFGLTVCIFVLFELGSTASSASQYVSSYYLHWAQLLLRPHCNYLRIICTVLNCLFSLTVLSSYYLHYAQLLLRPHSMCLNIICTVLNCFFVLTVCIFVLFEMCLTISSASLYAFSCYLNWVQLLLRPHCIYLRIIFTMLNSLLGLSADPTAKRSVIYSHPIANYSHHFWNLTTFDLKKNRYFRLCGLRVLRAQIDTVMNVAAA
jgi:hypothetical protein